MMTNLKWFAFAFAGISVALAADGARKTYPVPDKTKLELSVPTAWKDEVREGDRGMPPTIVFAPREGQTFQVLVTPIWRPRPDVPVPTGAQIRDSVQRVADQMKTQAVEKELPVIEFKGATGPGYYFSATDKAPAPNEFKYLTQGMLLVGELAVTFSILTNDGQEKVRDDALAMLKAATQSRP
jgi:hypothetical protein